ncbi:MAG TPA: TonB-dependent receptor [Candidatus Baltobacteraceae bacterium]|nr:TonB-dependent receptor [Candidatus Baltobacteraceae bacterium]
MKLRVLIYAVMAVLLLMPSFAAAAENTGTVTGTVHDSSGSPIADARIVATGVETRSVSSDSAGKFTLTLSAGVYRLDVSKGGYTSTTETDLSVLAGETLPVDVTLQPASLSSLKTIANVTTSARSSINTGAAAISITGRQEFQNLGSPQINDIVQRIPGAVVEHGSSSPNTSISLAGSQGYETQVMLDGHPLSAGRYGVWFSQFFNSFLVQDIETEIGPGNTTPLAGTAVGGTANIVTPGYTSKPTYEFTTGFDSYSSQYSNLLDTGKAGKLSYVFGVGTSGLNSEYTYKYGCVIDPGTKSSWNTSSAVGVIQWCGDLGGPQFNKGELLKAKWDFSPATSFELGFVGSQAGYMPQGSSYGVSTGPIKIEQCDKNGRCGNPAYYGMVGSTINGYSFYPGSNVYNNQPLFTAQLRTAIGDNTLLVRPYAGNITRMIDGSGEASYPIYWYSPSNSTTDGKCKSDFGAVGPTVNGLTMCKDTAFNLLESDKLKGGTISFIHPFGTNSVTATYDNHSDETFAYYGTPSAVAVPDTTARFNTFSLTGEFSLNPALTLKAGAYETLWALSGSQTGPFVGGKPTTVGLTRSVSRFDPHVALTYQAAPGTSLRFSAGTSTTFPYASQVSGKSSYTPPSATGNPFGVLSQKNPALDPEHAVEFDLGFDKRLHDGTIVSLDLADTQVHNVFETMSVPATSPPGVPSYSFINEPVNAANLSSELLMLTIRKEPVFGLGYYLSGTLARSIPTGVPLTASFSVPANGVQQCSDGGSATCIPYLKGYADISYTMHDRTFMRLGMDYEGKNNTYFQPPFTVFDMTLRRPVSKEVDVQVSAFNLLNTNTFSGLVEPNQGVAMTGEKLVCAVPAKGCVPTIPVYGPYPYNSFARIPVQPRTVRLQFNFHVNR